MGSNLGTIQAPYRGIGEAVQSTNKAESEQYPAFTHSVSEVQEGLVSTKHCKSTCGTIYL